MYYINEKLENGEIILSVFSDSQLEYIMWKLDSVIDKNIEFDINCYDDWGHKIKNSMNITINEIINIFEWAINISVEQAQVISNIINTFQHEPNVFNLYELVENGIEDFIENVQWLETDDF